MKTLSTGALIDTRPKEQKIKDFKFEEVVASADPVIWQSKSESEWRKFPIKDQKNSNQCVAFTLSKLLGVQHQLDADDFVDFSASHIYERRNNRPSAGMLGVDGFEIVRKEGATLEELYPTKQYNNDNESLNIKTHYAEVGKIFTAGGYLSLPIMDIESVASVIQRTKKAVMVWYWGTYDEWVRDVPIRSANTDLYNAPVRHSVTAVDYFTYKGKKALLIEDSWGLNHGMAGRRIVTEDFHNNRNFYAGYLMNFKFGTTPEAKFKITKTLSFGDRNEDVRELQEMLKHEGLFPLQITTDYYGAITARAVLDWQLKHEVAPVHELNALGGRMFGPASLRKFNQLY
jgi:hypothetical protein